MPRHIFASELRHADANCARSRSCSTTHLDSTERHMRVNAHELRGAIKRLRWVG
jgi:hypothetical protein